MEDLRKRRQGGPKEGVMIKQCMCIRKGKDFSVLREDHGEESQAEREAGMPMGIWCHVFRADGIRRQAGDSPETMGTEDQK